MDILAMSQEEVVQALIRKSLGNIAPDLKYVLMTFVKADSAANDSLCRVTLTGRNVTELGEPGKYTGNHSFTVRRATLKAAGATVALRVPYVRPMTLDEALQALYRYHSFRISADELLIKIPDGTDYQALRGNLRMTPGVYACKFSDNNLRFDPKNSDFTLELYQDERVDLGSAFATSTLASMSVAGEAS